MEMKKIENGNFCFNDLLYFDDLNIQIILKKIEIPLLAKALKDSSKEMQEKFFHNMKELDVSMLKEDIEWFENIQKSDVKNAQEEIKKIILQLDEKGEIQ